MEIYSDLFLGEYNPPTTPRGNSCTKELFGNYRIFSLIPLFRFLFVLSLPRRLSLSPLFLSWQLNLKVKRIVAKYR